MNTLGSPLAVQLLLHAHTTQTPFPNREFPAVRETICRLADAGLIAAVHGKDHVFTTMDKGLFLIEHLLAVPFPVAKWEIPS